MECGIELKDGGRIRIEQPVVGALYHDRGNLMRKKKVQSEVLADHGHVQRIEARPQIRVPYADGKLIAPRLEVFERISAFVAVDRAYISIMRGVNDVS